MVLVAARLEIARKIHRFIVGEKCYFLKASGPGDLRRFVHQAQPEVVVIDLALGEQWRALDAVPRMGLEESQPQIIVLAEEITPRLKEQAVELGCYDVIGLSERLFSRSFAESVAVALAVRPHRMKPPDELRLLSRLH